MFVDPKFLDTVVESSVAEKATACLRDGSIDYGFYDRRARRLRSRDFRAALALVGTSFLAIAGKLRLTEK